VKGFHVYSLRVWPCKLNRGSGANPWVFYISLVNYTKTLVGDVGLFCSRGMNGGRNSEKSGLQPSVIHGLF